MYKGMNPNVFPTTTYILNDKFANLTKHHSTQIVTKQKENIDTIKVVRVKYEFYRALHYKYIQLI